MHVPSVQELLNEVTVDGPHFTDRNIADRWRLSVESIRRVLRVLEFVAFAECIDQNPEGMTWETRKPNEGDPRVRLLRAELGKPVEGFLAAKIIQDVEATRDDFERAGGILPVQSHAKR